MSAWNLPARMLAVPLSTAVASGMFFLIPVMSSSGRLCMVHWLCWVFS